MCKVHLMSDIYTAHRNPPGLVKVSPSSVKTLPLGSQARPSGSQRHLSGSPNTLPRESMSGRGTGRIPIIGHIRTLHTAQDSQALQQCRYTIASNDLVYRQRAHPKFEYASRSSRSCSSFLVHFPHLTANKRTKLSG